MKNRNDYFREYRKKHRAKLRKYNRTYNRLWRKENGYHNEYNSKKKYPEKQYARRVLQTAVNFGKIIPLPCQKCGNKMAQAHHKDYNKPLDVIWLCALHHKELHMQGVEKLFDNVIE